MRIFLSYRRDDASAWAGRLRDTLAARFGERNIFQDVAAVRPGETFTSAIDAALASSDAVLAVIGPHWPSSRLAEPDDYVRAELAGALAQDKQLVPVLVGGASMPTADALPDVLKPLALRQAVVLRDTAWHQDVDALIASLRGTPESRQRRRWLGAAAAAAVLAAAGVAGWLLFGGGGGTSASSATTQTRPKSTGPTACPATGSDDWSDLHAAGAAAVGGADGMRFAVGGGRYRSQGSGRWYVVLRSRATNHTPSTEYHYPDFYKLESGGDASAPACFTVVGGHDPMDPGVSSTVLIGFETADDPTHGLVLSLNAFGDFGRLELTPSG